jgi:uncharacterized membrane-anchored protein YhcB (DUF1043 family)
MSRKWLYALLGFVAGALVGGKVLGSVRAIVKV